MLQCVVVGETTTNPTQLHNSLPTHLRHLVSSEDVNGYACKVQIATSRKKRLLLALALHRREQVISELQQKYQTSIQLNYAKPKQALCVKLNHVMDMLELMNDVRRIDRRLKAGLMCVGSLYFSLI